MLPVAAWENYLYSIDGADFRSVHHTFHSEHVAQNAAYIAPCYHMKRRGGRCAAAAAQNGGCYEVAARAIVKDFASEAPSPRRWSADANAITLSSSDTGFSFSASAASCSARI